MINFHTKQSAEKASLVGKFVFVEGGMIYPSVSRGMQVTSETGSSLRGHPLHRAFEEGVMVANGIRDDEIETIRKSSVTCECDTFEEVNAVFLANHRAKKLFEDSLIRGQALLAELEGVSVGPSAIIKESPKP